VGLISRTRVGAALGLAALALLTACSFNLGLSSTEPEKPKQHPPFARNPELARQQIAAIRLQDGISYSEASTIVNYYLQRHVPDRAKLMALTETDRYWLAQVVNTTTAEVMDARVRVDKQTGGVNWGPGPTVRNLEELLSK
jgi:hypothetical protein